MKYTTVKEKQTINSFFTKGKHLYENNFKLIYIPSFINQISQSNEIFFSIPKRLIKSAVKRNLLRRQLKYICQNFNNEEQGLSFALVFHKREEQQIPFTTIKHQVEELLIRFNTIVKTKTKQCM